MRSTDARRDVRFDVRVDAGPAIDAPLARVIPLRPLVVAGRPHTHEWVLVADESDAFGRVREFACLGCAGVHFA